MKITFLSRRIVLIGSFLCVRLSMSILNLKYRNLDELVSPLVGQNLSNISSTLSTDSVCAAYARTQAM